MARGRRSLPAFALYGEAGTPGAALLHVEPIAARSRLYRWEIGSHLHHGLHQVIWLHVGPVTAMLDESRAEGAGPLAIAIPSGVAHAFSFSPRSEGHVLTFDPRLISEDDAEQRMAGALQSLFAAPRMLPVPAHTAARLHALFGQLLAEHESSDPGPVTGWLARAVLWRLAAVAWRDETPARRAAQPLYTRWVALAEAHYRDHWPVTRYAAQLGLSAERLNRMVRNETGANAQALLHTRLVREACRRLVHIAAPVSRIAFELGFEDAAYFSRFFRRHVGVAPGEYRRRAALGGAP
jgi:AraC family transcriptional activator of pobA